MADSPVSDVRMVRTKANAALFLSLLALLLALICLAFVMGARNRAEDAQSTAREAKNLVEELKTSENAPAASGGVGENNTLPADDTGNMLPNGNGQ